MVTTTTAAAITMTPEKETNKMGPADEVTPKS